MEKKSISQLAAMFREHYKKQDMNMKTKVLKLKNGQFDLQEKFEYMGVPFTCKSWGKGSTAHSYHVVEGEINGQFRVFSSTTRKQAKDMFKKAVRKNLIKTNKQ